MRLVEQHIIRKGDPRYAKIDAAAFASKNLWNAANYLVRQSFIFQEKYLNTTEVFHQIKSHEAYQALPRKVSNQVLIQLHDAWKAFFEAIAEWREQLGLKKTRKKLAEVWEAHCVDSWVLARAAVGGATAPDNTRLVCMAPFVWHHRQLHRFQPEKGSKRKPYGGTLSQGVKRGTLVKHPKWGKATVGGTMDGKLSLHHPATNKRLTQTARVADCTLITLLRWRTRLVPLTQAPASPAPKQGTPASSPGCSQGYPQAEVL